jgi:putative ABC transport system permease protein
VRTSDYAHDIARVLARNRFRTLLTLLGIVIGSGTIVFLAGVLSSANEALLDLTQTVSDADVVVVRRDDAPPAQAARPQRELSTLDAEALRRSPLDA